MNTFVFFDRLSKLIFALSSTENGIGNCLIICLILYFRHIEQTGLLLWSPAVPVDATASFLVSICVPPLGMSRSFIKLRRPPASPNGA